MIYFAVAGTCRTDQRLRALLQRLSDYNATVRVDKCVIGAPEVEFNGHHNSAAGIRPLQSNVDALMKIPAPVDKRSLTRFVCTAAYYLKFVPDFATLCRPLRQLMKDGVEWNWDSECQRNFDALKERIARPPILAHFNADRKQ